MQTLCFVLAVYLATILSVFPQTVPSATTNSVGALVLTNHFGDFNNDGVVNVLDVVLLTRHLTGTASLSPDKLPRADLDQDGAATDVDRIAIGDMILKLRTGPEEDFDDDDLANAEEVRRGTNPFNPDTDRDGWLDGLEVADGTGPLDAQSHNRLLAFSSPPLEIASAPADIPGAEESPVIAAGPPVEVLHTGPDEPRGLESFAAAPPVEIALPDSDLQENSGITVAAPPVELLNPAFDERSGPEMFVATPPLEIVLPATDDAEHPGVTMANPTVLVVLPSLDPLDGSETFVAWPPIEILSPDSDWLGVPGSEPYLAQPPLEIRILQP